MTRCCISVLLHVENKRKFRLNFQPLSYQSRAIVFVILLFIKNVQLHGWKSSISPYFNAANYTYNLTVKLRSQNIEAKILKCCPVLSHFFMLYVILFTILLITCRTNPLIWPLPIRVQYKQVAIKT